MRFSQLFTKTRKENPRDETSANAILLERGGFVAKNSAGIYSFLPLGWKTIQRIMNIVREEMNAIGGQEMFMQTMVEKKYLDPTKRWDIPVGFKIQEDSSESHFVLGWTHEEVITTLASHYVESYRDLPFAAYQIQTKFRKEARATSGLLRGREFLMKDLYSFHAAEEDLRKYYQVAAEAYKKIFQRCGLDALYTKAGGGDFTAGFTHEFQVLTPVGEDTVLHCPSCHFAVNSEVAAVAKGDACPECEKPIQEDRGIEVGNIFPLGTKYSQSLQLHYRDERGEKKPVVMGSYGIGVSRLMGTIVEIHHDERGIVWPRAVAPYTVHLIPVNPEDKAEAEKLYTRMLEKNIEVLYDDRSDVRAGEKFSDADLLGMPLRVVIGEKSRKGGGVEIKERQSSAEHIMNSEESLLYAEQYLQ